MEFFYTAYLAVFDRNGIKLKSTVKELNTDFLFVGVRTYQGWSTWNVDLWKAGTKWVKKWTLKDSDSIDESLPAEISDNGLKVFERITENKDSKSMIPEWRLEYRYKLIWDRRTEKFIKQR